MLQVALHRLHSRDQLVEVIAVKLHAQQRRAVGAEHGAPLLIEPWVALGVRQDEVIHHLDGGWSVLED